MKLYHVRTGPNSITGVLMKSGKFSHGGRWGGRIRRIRQDNGEMIEAETGYIYKPRDTKHCQKPRADRKRQGRTLS